MVFVASDYRESTLGSVGEWVSECQYTRTGIGAHTPGTSMQAERQVSVTTGNAQSADVPRMELGSEALLDLAEAAKITKSN